MFFTVLVWGWPAGALPVLRLTAVNPCSLQVISLLSTDWIY